MKFSLQTVIFNCPKSADCLRLSATGIFQKSDKSHVRYFRFKEDSILIYYGRKQIKNIRNYSVLLEMFQKCCFKGDCYYDIPLFPVAKRPRYLNKSHFQSLGFSFWKWQSNWTCHANSIPLSLLFFTLVLNELAPSLMIRSFESLSSRRPAAPGCGSFLVQCRPPPEGAGQASGEWVISPRSASWNNPARPDTSSRTRSRVF